jgi:hypothetical protein
MTKAEGSNETGKEEKYGHESAHFKGVKQTCCANESFFLK